jgi:DNA-binding MarR family transcriptional regulator
MGLLASCRAANVTEKIFQRGDRYEQQETIEFSQKDRDDAVRLFTLIAGKSRAEQINRQIEALPIARAILEDRRLRSRMFNPSMFGEVGWELLLSLYVNDQKIPRLTMGNLIKVAGTPKSTSLRWLDYLEDHGMISRQQNRLTHEQRSSR